MTDHPPVEINAEKANSASMALNSLAGDLQIADVALGDALDWFADEYGQHRVEAHDGVSDDSETIELRLSPEAYRTIAAGLRMEALRRNAEAVERDPGGLGEAMADDYRELARLFDKAAERAETTDD